MSPTKDVNPYVSLRGIDKPVPVTGEIAIEAATSPTIYNILLSDANTEYPVTLNGNTKSFLLRCRNDSILQMSFIAGTSNTNFITIPRGCSYEANNLDFSGMIYVQTNRPSQVIEILEWV